MGAERGIQTRRSGATERSVLERVRWAERRARRNQQSKAGRLKRKKGRHKGKASAREKNRTGRFGLNRGEILGVRGRLYIAR